LLEIIPFSSRRRMSVIVKAICENDEILIFTKGADSAIFEKSIPYKHQIAFQANIDEYAIEGLRTLVFGYRKMTSEEYQSYE
jgi:magnesium-transporting ATPase (P-type)